ncbi:MAG: hypothetical protein ABIR52_05635, partial [Casimicrobiaceae bacterium]
MRRESIIPAGDLAAGPAPAGGLRIAGGLATLLALALVAMVVAYWGWQILAPPRVHIAAATPADPAAALLASGLFADVSPSSSASAANDATAQGLPGDARLLGVFAEPDGRGYALFRLASGPRLVAVGNDIAPGAT